MINYQRHRAALERLYEDKCTISRYSSAKDPVSKETVQTAVIVVIDQPCRISQKALGSNSQTEAQNDIRYETKLFISPDIEIKQGDEIAVIRGATTHKYQAGEPFPYPTHQEISIQRKDRA
ncbi:ABC transporter ATP-binding protein [Paenibacillus sinopodophylli]|uniref:ABC transporter ATP-binding protein n=1 Tax=Paenibacillus sinopodophylli TaxID=1837342 RepID=UPI00110CBC63|nr:ABC transporter ATP-binding protein [Paenibacillus sinopodophylli]